MKAGRKIFAMILAAAFFMLSGCAYVQTIEQDAAGSGSGTETGMQPEEEESNDLAANHAKKTSVYLNPEWEWAALSEINDGCAVLYFAPSGRKDIVIGVNAGHGTIGGEYVKTYCHPDKTPKVTNGTNPAGSLKATAISAGMIFNDGTYEADVSLRCAQILRDELLERGYDVLMLRDSEDVQLDNVARTVISNNMADCMVSLHWDGDGLKYDKGCFYPPVPDEIKDMEPVASCWQEHDKLGGALMEGLRGKDCKIYQGRIDPLELTQTCYSTIPAALIELGNGASAHDDKALKKLADGLLDGIELYKPQKLR